MKVVFLHGIGDCDPRYEWLDGINRGLMQAAHDPTIGSAETTEWMKGTEGLTSGPGGRRPRSLSGVFATRGNVKFDCKIHYNS